MPINASNTPPDYLDSNVDPFLFAVTTSVLDVVRCLGVRRCHVRRSRTSAGPGCRTAKACLIGLSVGDGRGRRVERIMPRPCLHIRPRFGPRIDSRLRFHLLRSLGHFGWKLSIGGGSTSLRIRGSASAADPRPGNGWRLQRFLVQSVVAVAAVGVAEGAGAVLAEDRHSRNGRQRHFVVGTAQRSGFGQTLACQYA